MTIPAPGWFGKAGDGQLTKNESADPPDGAGLIGPWFGALYVFGDPCHWSTTTPDTPATTVDAFVKAIMAQASRDASEPVETTIDGHSGTLITLHTPDDAAFAEGTFTECDQGYFASWTRGPGRDLERYSQGPGQIDKLWILDVDGLLAVIDATYYAGTPGDHVREVLAIVESAAFDLP